MALRKKLIRRMGVISTMSSSKNPNRNIISELLQFVKRHKTKSKKVEKEPSNPRTEETIEESFNSLTAQSERVGKNIKMYFLQNKKILEDNRYIFSNVMKYKKENTDKLKDVFVHAFSMLHLLDKESGNEQDQVINICRTSTESINSKTKKYSEDLENTLPQLCNVNISKHSEGFKRRASHCNPVITADLNRT